MGSENGLLQWLVRNTEFTAGQPLAELAGDRRLLIENHGGVTQYSREQICIRVRYGLMEVRGNELELALMNREKLVITGRIDGISLCRRKVT